MEQYTYSLSSRALRNYCRKTSNEFCQSLEIKGKVRLLAFRIPFSNSNGFTFSIGIRKKRTNFVFVNLWPYRTSAVSSTAMAYFFLCSVIAHELKHIKILQDWQKGESDFRVLFSEWAVAQICTEILPERIIQNYLTFKGASTLRKKRYAVSPIELICFQYGFCEAFLRFSQHLSPEEYIIAKTAVDSIDFVNQHMEIDYYSSKQAYNRFTHTLTYFAKFLRKHPGSLRKFPQLSRIFTMEGVIKSPVQMFMERTKETEEIVDDMLIRLFITLPIDWTPAFASREDFFNHMVALANNYCEKTVYYLKHISLGEVFLHKDILQDNAAMLIKNVSTLNKLMDKYGMPYTTGSVLPVYYFDDFARGVR